MAQKKRANSAKASVKKRTLNPSGTAKPKTGGAPFNELDPKRRLGQFEGAGEHPRVGGRGTGIVGQTTKQAHTDQKKRKTTSAKGKRGK